MTGLIGQQDSQVAKIVSGWASHDAVTESLKKRKRIKSGEMRLKIEPATLGPIESRPIDNCTRRRTVAIDAIGSCAENGDVFGCNLLRACEDKLLISSADAAILYLDRYFAAGDETNSRGLLPEIANSA